MKLELKCQADEFARFKSGTFKSIVVAGTRKIWENGSNVNLGDLIVVMNGSSPRTLTFEVSQVIEYTGAATLDTALSDLGSRFGASGEGYESSQFYMSPDGQTRLVPPLYEGIYAIMLRQYKKKSRGGGKNGGNVGNLYS